MADSIADLPARLSGDRAARLFILDFGLFRVHENGRVIGIPGYLIETAGGLRILIDTGFPPAYATDGAAAAARDGLGAFGEVLHLTPENLPAGQLAKIGLTPADIDLVVLTHGHIDHVGGLPGLTHCPLVLSRAERATARPLYFGRARPMEWPRAAYHLIDSDTALCRGLTLLMTPGHTPGHISALVDLPDTGAVLLTADAISRPEEIGEGFAGSWSPALAAASARRILKLAEDRRAWVIYGHGPDQWPRLTRIPGFYA